MLLTHGYFLADDAVERRIMRPYPPLGLLAVATYLRSRGIEARVWDSTFRTRDEFAAMIVQEHPAIVGIYVTLMTKRAALWMMAFAKEHGAIVILGGPEPAPNAAEYLARGADVIVEGEGELTVEELLGAIDARGVHRLHDVRGVWFRDDAGTVVRTEPRALIPDLDQLPIPDRSLIDLNLYLDAWRTHHGASSISLICARGCPYHCLWCSHAVYGETHRRRSPARVADEAEMLVATYHPDQFWYADDVFTIHHRWLFDYAAELARRGLRVPFECISRADRLNEQVIDTLAAMGCRRLWIGSESGSQRILDAMRREVTVDEVRRGAAALRARGIEVGMFLMVGYEGEEERDLRDTVQLVRDVAPDLLLTTLAYPIAGTGYFRAVAGKVLARAAWEERTDRDLTIAGRHTARYYSFAQRWIHGAHAVARQKHGRAGIAAALKGQAQVIAGRIGMALARGEREK